MEKQPYFSIITCTLNSERTIARTISSVQSQTFKNFQHIIMDGGSQDLTLEIVHDLIDDKTFPYVVPDKGIYEGFNNGMEKAVGKYIVFLNSDDKFYSSTVLQEIYNATQAQLPDIAYGNINLVDETGKCVRNWVAGQFYIRKLKFGWCAPHPGFFFLKNAFDHTFYEDLKISSDYGFMLTCFLKPSVNVVYVNRTITDMSTGGVSNSGVRSMIEKLLEDRNILRRVGIGSWLTVLFKRLIKFKQFIG